MCFRVIDEFSDGSGRNGGIHLHYPGVRMMLAIGAMSRLNLKGRLAKRGFIDRIVGSSQQKRLAVGWCFRDCLRRKIAAGSAAILYNEPPTQALTQPLRNQSCDNIARAPRRKSN